MTAPRKNELMHSAAKTATDLVELEAQRRCIALEAFRTLEQYDLETAILAMTVFEDRDDAAIWFTRTLPFSGVTPWDLLAAGEVEKVREILKTVTGGEYPFDW